MPDLEVVRLDKDRLAQAYPLIRSATQVSSDRWDDYGREIIAAGGGVLAVTTGSACVHGVAAFRLGGSLRHERMLQVEIFTTFELSPMAPVRGALRAELEAIAREQGCPAIVFTMTARNHADPSTARRASWAKMGLKLETVGFVGTVQP